MHSEHFFKYKDTQLHYSKRGSGKKVLIAYHGFGQNHEAFDLIIDQLKDRYTIFSFDLFFHGKSTWDDNNKLSKSFWKDLIHQFGLLHDIQQFDLLCFSLGGKFALATVEMMPERINQLVMIAPDGIETSLWYNLATYPLFFQKLFKSMIFKPHRFFNILRVLKKLQLVDKGILKFARSQMSTAEKRSRVYYSWIVFKDLQFQLNQMAQIINKHNINLVMILGKYDKIITKKGMSKLLNKLTDSTLYIIDSGHNDLLKNTSKRSDIISNL